MTAHDLIKQKADLLPENLAEEAVNFIDFLLHKRATKYSVPASEKTDKGESLYDSLIQIASLPLEDPKAESFSSAEDIDSVLYGGDTVK